MPTPNTEKRHPDAQGLDQLSGPEILAIMHKGHLDAAQAAGTAMDSLAKGAEAMAAAVRNGNKLVYAAAGSSGIQGMADGLELTPTFGIPIARIKILRAGGLEDLSRPKGEAEDDVEAALKDAEVIEKGDCVICIAASGNTTYPVTVMGVAKERGATTIGFSNNPDTKLLEGADIPVLLPTPPEVIAGSTRLGAGTAQKIALNMMSSLTGVLLGNVMDGLMVNPIPNNAKIFRRAEGIVMEIAGCGRETAASSLEASDGSVKEAILIASGAKDRDEASDLLEQADQNLRAALKKLG